MKCRKCHREIDDDSSYCKYCGTKQKTEKRTRRGNGEGSVYKEKNGTWTVELTVGYKVNDGDKAKRVRKKQRGFKTKKEAIEHIPQLSAKNVKKNYTIEHYWQEYKNSELKTISANRQRHYKYCYEKMQPLHFRDIRELELKDLNDAVDLLGTSYYQQRDGKTVLSKIYQIAMLTDDVHQNLALHITLPDHDEKSPDPFTREELEKLWTAYSNGVDFVSYILLMTYTGMMPGELRQLAKPMVDLEHRIVNGDGLKTEVRRSSSIVLPDCIIPILSDLIESSEMLLCPYSKSEFYSKYYAALKSAGVEKHTPYACRHTTATALTWTNTNPAIIQKVMRHAKITTTQRYIHTSEDQKLEAVNSLPSALPSAKEN